ncbi:MAG TPA: hypothetical protein VMY39_00840 [Planctomycetota bacterium]|nr:hypothetical protein [Planctomycetota bacterium]
MIDSERALKIILRLVGLFCLLALAAAFAPTSLLAWCHEQLGFGEFPATPVVEYLARSVSLFYAGLGGLLLVTSADVRRAAPVITYLAVAGLVFSIVILFVDEWVGLPTWWSVGECVSLLPLCVVILWLQVRMTSTVAKEKER